MFPVKSWEDSLIKIKRKGQHKFYNYYRETLNKIHEHTDLNIAQPSLQPCKPRFCIVFWTALFIVCKWLIERDHFHSTVIANLNILILLCSLLLSMSILSNLIMLFALCSFCSRKIFFHNHGSTAVKKVLEMHVYDI